MTIVQLSDQINDYFNAEEMEDLCFRLGIQFDNLPGNTNSAKARELTDYCRRHGRMDDLVSLCRELRKHVLWVEPESLLKLTNEQAKVFDNPVMESSGTTMPTTMPNAPKPPSVTDMFWMAYPNTWYGPFDGFSIGWMPTGGFQVWHPMMGAIVYPDPFNQLQRNMWVRLYNTPFNVYVDGGLGSYVYAQYSPT